MIRDTNAALPDTDFWRAYSGKFSGVLGWPQFDALWDQLGASDGTWFVFDPAGDAPESAIAGAEFATILNDARAVVEQMRSRSFCGSVFVDDTTAPAFIKVFDPYKMGASCGSSGERVLPRWIFSRIAPDALPMVPEEPEKKGFFARLVG